MDKLLEEQAKLEKCKKEEEECGRQIIKIDYDIEKILKEHNKMMSEMNEESKKEKECDKQSTKNHCKINEDKPKNLFDEDELKNTSVDGEFTKPLQELYTSLWFLNNKQNLKEQQKSKESKKEKSHRKINKDEPKNIFDDDEFNKAFQKIRTPWSLAHNQNPKEQQKMVNEESKKEEQCDKQITKNRR